MLLSVDDIAANSFNVPDAAALDGQAVTVITRDGTAQGRAVIRALSANAISLEGFERFAEEDRFTIRTDSMVQGKAVRLRQVETRPEQEAFREAVGEAWGWRCAITGETVREVLEAAHLPGASWRGVANTAEHGILLRADLHRLLDAGLLTIEAGVVRVRAGGYGALDGMRVEPPSAKEVGRHTTQ